MNKNIKIGFGAFSFLLFVVLAYFITANQVLVFDTVIAENIYSLRNSVLTVILKVVTYAGNWQTVTFLCLLALILPMRRKSFGIPMATAAIVSTVLYKGLKTFFVRPRPDISLHLIEQGGYSFPSGHSMTGLVFYGMILWLCYQQSSLVALQEKKGFNILTNKSFIYGLTVALSLLILLIGFSRIYLGVHYPTDVLAGWAVGFILLLCLTTFWKGINK